MRTKSLLSFTWVITLLGVAGLAAVVWFSLPTAKVSAQSAEALCVDKCNDSYSLCHDTANDNLEGCLDKCGKADSACRENCTDAYKNSQDKCTDAHNSCLKTC